MSFDPDNTYLVDNYKALVEELGAAECIRRAEANGDKGLAAWLRSEYGDVKPDEPAAPKKETAAQKKAREKAEAEQAATEAKAAEEARQAAFDALPDDDKAALEALTDDEKAALAELAAVPADEA